MVRFFLEEAKKQQCVYIVRIFLGEDNKVGAYVSSFSLGGQGNGTGIFMIRIFFWGEVKKQQLHIDVTTEYKNSSLNKG